MNRDDLLETLQLVQGLDLSADDAFKEIEPALYERDRLRAQLEVAQQGYRSAVLKAEWQAQTNREMNECETRLRHLEATFGHIHQNAQDGTDACGRCGFDLRDPIHRVEW